MSLYKETTNAGVTTAAVIAAPTMMDTILAAFQSDVAATGFDKLIIGALHALAGAMLMNKRHTGAMLNFGGGNN